MAIFLIYCHKFVAVQRGFEPSTVRLAIEQMNSGQPDYPTFISVSPPSRQEGASANFATAQCIESPFGFEPKSFKLTV